MKDEDVHYWRKRCEVLLSANIELKEKNQQLEKKLYIAKVQESLTKPIVDEYGKAS